MKFTSFLLSLAMIASASAFIPSNNLPTSSPAHGRNTMLKMNSAFDDEIGVSKPLSISGTVFNDEGKPSRRAQIKIFDLNDQLISIEKTNRKGRFEFLEILPDFYFLHVEHLILPIFQIQIAFQSLLYLL